MAALPYMQLYVADYLADTAHLNATEHGAYLMLLMNYWQRGKPLPDDDERLAMIARTSVEQWLNIRSTVVEFFSNENGFLVHHRVEKDLEKVRSKSNSAAMAGKVSAEKRQSKQKVATDVERTLNHTDTDTDTEKKYDKPKRATASRLPSDFHPPPEWFDDAKRLGLSEKEAQNEADRFRDFWIAKAGRDAKKLDWRATWRNWCRNSRGQYSKPPGPNGRAGGGNGRPADPVEIRNRLHRQIDEAENVSAGGRILRSVGVG